MKDGNIFSGKLVEAVPQPSCPLVGEVLVNADNTPAAALNEKYFVLEETRRALVPRELNIKCLQRPLAGQKYVKKVAPKVFETNNVHGGHNHSTLMPKVTQAYIQPLSGTTKTRVKPSNAENCTLNVSNVLTCAGLVYDGVTGSNGGGDFRAVSAASKVDFDDPIVYPNEKGRAHAHTFFGNNSVNYQTNNASLLDSCVSLFSGGRANCTGYWMPSVIDTATNTAILPPSILIYYKAGLDDGPTEPVPKGLKIIAGLPNRTPGQPEGDNIRIECFPRGSAPYIDTNVIPACSGEDYKEIWFTVDFPKCVATDGTGKMVLDSPDHRSHLVPPGFTYQVVNGKRVCPPAYPHPISSIAQIATYKIERGQNTATWRLSSDNYDPSLAGGASLHADWWGGWQDYWMARLVDQCNLRAFNCGVNYIGLNDGVGISNITTVGNVATITTAVPHLLLTSNGDGTYPVNLGAGAIQKLLGKISGVTGVSAASYNYDPLKLSTKNTQTNLLVEAASGAQPLKILNATQIEYTLNSTPATPINGPVDPAVVKVRWAESLCGIIDSCASEEYNTYYYGNKN